MNKPTEKTISWGIMGPGKIARKFARDLQKVPHAKLYAVASRNYDRAEAFGKEYSLLCLSRKKAVLCEKPLALDTTQAQEMIAASKAHHVLLMEAMWTAFLPHFQAAMQQN